MNEWSPPDRSRSRAVLIGTSRYDELTQVPAAANSLESMYRLLTGPLCGWPANCVTRIPEPKEPGNLPDRLVELFRQAKDVALFYYVGHGQVDFEDQLCLGLVGSRVQSERRATTSLTFEAVRRALRASPAATKVVILDCCFAGHAVQDRNALAGTDELDIAGLVGASGAYTLTATGPAGTAWFESDVESPLPHTHFTRALIDAVTRGIPGAPTVLTLEPVYHRLRETLAAAGKPAPSRVSRHNADAFVFARNAAPLPEPASPPRVTDSAPNMAVRRRQLLDMAEEAARAIEQPHAHCHALIDVATQAGRDDPDRVRRLLEEAERITPTIKDLKDLKDQAALWWSLADTVQASDPGRARGYLAALEQAITDPSVPEDSRDSLLFHWSLYSGTVLRLDPDMAERLARITSEGMRHVFITSAVRAVATRDPGRAERLARIASGDDAEDYGEVLQALASAVRDRDPDRAERIARAITHARSQCLALAELAGSVASFDIDRADGLLDEAERAASRASDADEISWRLRLVVDGLISGAGGYKHVKNGGSDADWIAGRAKRILQKIPSDRTAAYAAFLAGHAMPGKSAHSRELLEFAVSKREAIRDPWARHDSSYILRDVATAMLDVDSERAIAIALSMELSEYRDTALIAIMRGVAMRDPGKAEILAYHVSSPEARAGALSIVAAAMAEGDAEAAMILLQHARRTGRAAGKKAPTAVASAISALDPDLAVRILTEDGGASQLGDGLWEISTVVMENDPERAGQIALGIPDPIYRSRLLTRIAAHVANSTQPSNTLNRIYFLGRPATLSHSSRQIHCNGSLFGNRGAGPTHM